MRMKTIAGMSGIAMLAAATTASAHTDAGVTHGVIAGLAHPVQGADHLLAMIAAGLWAARLGGTARWLLPAAFLAAMALGGSLGFAPVSLPAVELGIAGSVLVFGLLLAFSARLPLAAGAAVVALFALLHGHAHGAELAAGASAWSYAAGFLTTSGLLLAVGVAAGLLTAGTRHPVTAGRLVAAAGALLMVGAV